MCGEYSLRVVSKDPQVSRQNRWWLFQVTCRPNIPVSDPQYSAVFIFIFSSCLSVVAVNVVAVSKDPCCLHEHLRFMLCKLTQTISSCVPVCTIFTFNSIVHAGFTFNVSVVLYDPCLLTKSCELIVVCAANIVYKSFLRTRRSPVKTGGGCFK